MLFNILMSSNCHCEKGSYFPASLLLKIVLQKSPSWHRKPISISSANTPTKHAKTGRHLLLEFTNVVKTRQSNSKQQTKQNKTHFRSFPEAICSVHLPRPSLRSHHLPRPSLRSHHFPVLRAGNPWLCLRTLIKSSKVAQVPVVILINGRDLGLFKVWTTPALLHACAGNSLTDIRKLNIVGSLCIGSCTVKRYSKGCQLYYFKPKFYVSCFICLYEMDSLNTKVWRVQKETDRKRESSWNL